MDGTECTLEFGIWNDNARQHRTAAGPGMRSRDAIVNMSGMELLSRYMEDPSPKNWNCIK